jgi:hypothetical protein
LVAVCWALLAALLGHLLEVLLALELVALMERLLS